MSWKRSAVTLVGATVLTFAITVTAGPAFADCKDEIADVAKDMKDNRDKYTADAVKDARKNLEQARRAGDRSAECRRDVLEARKTLEKGKK
jgi:hypothetical protein